MSWHGRCIRPRVAALRKGPQMQDERSKSHRDRLQAEVERLEQERVLLLDGQISSNHRELVHHLRQNRSELEVRLARLRERTRG